MMGKREKENVCNFEQKETLFEVAGIDEEQEKLLVDHLSKFCWRWENLPEKNKELLLESVLLLVKARRDFERKIFFLENCGA